MDIIITAWALTVLYLLFNEKQHEQHNRGKKNQRLYKGSTKDRKGKKSD